MLRDLALIDLLFATGIRVGEVSALDIRDFFVREAAFRMQGKGGRDRLAFIVDEETVRIQRAHFEACGSIKTESLSLFINEFRPQTPGHYELSLILSTDCDRSVEWLGTLPNAQDEALPLIARVPRTKVKSNLLVIDVS